MFIIGMIWPGKCFYQTRIIPKQDYQLLVTKKKILQTKTAQSFPGTFA
jgi:hypothetical protein